MEKAVKYIIKSVRKVEVLELKRAYMFIVIIDLSTTKMRKTRKLLYLSEHFCFLLITVHLDA